MNPETDRIQVPTNGRGPHPPTPDGPAAEAVAGAGRPSRPGGPDGHGEPGPGGEPGPTVTPAQLAAGFGIVASLVLLLVGRRRRRRG